MAVKITNETMAEERTRQVALTVSDAPDFPRPYAPPQTIRPLNVGITLKQRGGGPWYHYRTTLSGPRVLVNGREGSDLFEEFFKMTDAPEWLQRLVDHRIDSLNEKS